MFIVKSYHRGLASQPSVYQEKIHGTLRCSDPGPGRGICRLQSRDRDYDTRRNRRGSTGQFARGDGTLSGGISADRLRTAAADFVPRARTCLNRPSYRDLRPCVPWSGWVSWLPAGCQPVLSLTFLLEVLQYVALLSKYDTI